MAFDTFVRIDGIEAESTDGQHRGWIEAFNFKVAVKQRISTTASSAGGATAGRADFEPLNFTMLTDKASPKLYLACAAGTHIDEIVVEACRAGGDRVPFMNIRLQNCIIKRIFTIGDGRYPVESVSIDYGRIFWVYLQQSRTHGGPVGQVAAGWSREKNCRL